MVALDDVPPPMQPALAQIRHLFGCHLRHCAGRPPASADLLHLGELINRLDELVPRVAGVPILGEVLSSRLAILRPELATCIAAHQAPPSPAQRAHALVVLTNQQFLLYRRLFAGRARLTRRRELLHRLHMTLTMIRHEMGHIGGAELPSATDHAANAELVAKEIVRLETEDGQLFAAQRRARREELIRQFGVDVNAEILAYRRAVAEPDHDIVNLDVLAGICDRLGELAYQMMVLADRTDDTVHLANLRLASTHLARYEQEYLRLHQLTNRADETLAASEMRSGGAGSP
jgi:hypothetical protein